MDYARRLFLVIGAVAGACSIGYARASVTISSANTQNMSCANGVCEPTAKDAVLNAGDLETMLAAGSVEVTTTGAGVEAMAMAVKAPLSWSTNNNLTISSAHWITIDAPVAVTGAGGLSLFTPAPSASGEILIGSDSAITFADLSSALVIDGQRFALVDSLPSLAAAIAADPAGHYALAAGYDASGDGTYSAPPIPETFSGVFDGLGNSISNLAVADGTDANVGLFAQIGRGGQVRHVSLVNAAISATSNNVSAGPLAGTNSGFVLQASASGRMVGGLDGSVGGLVGYSGGAIERSDASTAIDGRQAQADYGGLVGQMAFSRQAAILRDSHASGDVIGACGSSAGGLVGAGAGIISNSYVTGRARGSGAAGLVGAWGGGPITSSHAGGAVESCNGGFAGGLIAIGGATLSDSYATGNVSGKPYSQVGGLIGDAEAGSGVTRCHSSGSVTAGKGSEVGGFVGWQDATAGPIDDTTGAVEGGASSYVGGFAGVNIGAIGQSWASGSVKGGRGAYVGGLIGYNYAYNGNGGAASVANSYSEPATAAPNVRGGRNSAVGGLIGYNVLGATVSSSYATGAPSAAKSFVGGVVGYDASHIGQTSGFADAYWDTTTSGIANLGQGAGNIANDPGIAGLTSNQLRSGLPPGFDRTIWAEKRKINDGFPYLRGLPPETAGIDGPTASPSLRPFRQARPGLQESVRDLFARPPPN